jgi:DNA primase
VDKVGPYDAKFKIKDIEDTRSVKREQIALRAKELLEKLKTKHIPEKEELALEIKEGVRTAKIQSYGNEKLPCGPTIEEEDSIIVVEGRADVINLLKNNIKNVIGMEGAKVPRAIVDLSRRKTMTIFVDGDRGGDLIARKVAQLANVEFIAKAPDGKEVEELTRKEIVMSLRRKAPVAQAVQGTRSERPFARTPMSRPSRGGYSRGPSRDRGPARGGSRERGFRSARGGSPSRGFGRPPGRFTRRPRFGLSEEREIEIAEPVMSAEEETKFKPVMEELKGSLNARLFDAKMTPIKEVPVRELVDTLATEKKPVYAVVFDGIITKRLAEEADKKGIEYLVGVRKGKIEKGLKVKALTA